MIDGQQALHLGMSYQGKFMCIFSGPVTSVGGTKIFARRHEPWGSQCLVYSMHVNAPRDVAMILPLPVAGPTDDAVKFVALDGYPAFFEDMEKGFPRTRGSGLAKGMGQSELKVHQVGNFVASFVPGRRDFVRLSPQFRLPAQVLDAMYEYETWGFAVFQLRAANQTVHPMAMWFPTNLPHGIFFPTKHVHDGNIPKATADFDHELYFQGPAITNVRNTRVPASAFMKDAQGLVDPNAVIQKMSLAGTLMNRDQYI